jgi:hypothetical protein
MTLTNTITVDLVGQTQTISFYEGASLVDQIEYSTSGVTFSTISSFNLSKSDCILYNTYLILFYNTLLLNFPYLNLQLSGIWPLCVFEISETFAGVNHIIYTQTSQGNSVYSTNYVPQASSAGHASRSQITITIQEFYMTQIMLRQYYNQVSLN